MRRTTLALLLGAGALLTGGAFAADDKKGAPDEKALLEALQKAATPGEHHKALEPLAGSWTATVKMWLDPSKPPTESKATSEAKWIMGGRYLEEKVTGEFGGMPFHGQSITGYDNLKKKYVSVWVDNLGTGLSFSSGSYDPDKKTLTFHREETDPASGQKVKTKDVMRLTDNDKHEIESYRLTDDKEVKVMHIVYTRKK
jgi:hypothetical protein